MVFVIATKNTSEMTGCINRIVLLPFMQKRDGTLPSVNSAKSLQNGQPFAAAQNLTVMSTRKALLRATIVCVFNSLTWLRNGGRDRD